MKTINWIRDEHKDWSFQFHLYKTSEAGAFELYLMPTPNYCPRAQIVSAILLASHYLIKNNGEIITLVPELYISWHAGVSFWKNYHSLNKN